MKRLQPHNLSTPTRAFVERAPRHCLKPPELVQVDGAAKDHACTMLMARMASISHAFVQTAIRNADALGQAVDQIAAWVTKGSSIRIIAAGRAKWAAAMPGNRLAHASGWVSFMNDLVPLPHTSFDGGIIALSASGKTPEVRQAIESAKRENPAIVVLGFASYRALPFKALCDIFVGIHVLKAEYKNPVSALADTEEYVMSELLDGLVVLAGRRLGFDDNTWLHENLGARGPYDPKKLPPILKRNMHRPLATVPAAADRHAASNSTEPVTTG